MAEPAEILAAVEAVVAPGPLQGRRVLVTAGPTREYLDPVRFLSNRSSGRMGFALAAEAARRGAETLLVSGPSALPTPAGVRRLDVESAAEMRTAVAEWAPGCDLVVMAAAIADYRPRRRAERKLKKSAGPPEIELVENPDVLAELAAVAPGAVRVGFAAETGDLDGEARRKLVAKDADFIVANDVSSPDVGFDAEENEVRVFSRRGEPVTLGRRSKAQLAADLLDLFLGAARAEPALAVAGGDEASRRSEA
jgi:phosphopantothenoylcysteine decarboxylase/phosphopantothenate--cysteine ligase